MTAARGRAVVALLVAVVLVQRPHPAATQTEPEAVRALGADLSTLIAPSAAIWSVVVQSLDRDETLYTLNPRTLLDPASTIKILTLAAAAERLGWDYRYETELVATAPTVAGTVTGDLVVRGTGDPTINVPGGREEVFTAWAHELRATGIVRIAGRIIGDDSAFSDDVWTGWGPGWGWDDLAFGFAAPSGALQHHGNIVLLTIRPGDRAGDPVELTLDQTSGLELVNLMKTGPRGAERSLTLRRLPGPGDLVVRGTIPAGAPALTREVAVDNPTLFFVTNVRQQLLANGVAVSGAAIDIDDLPADARPDARQLTTALVRHHSVPLSELAVEMMKDSQNLYAESLLRTVALVSPPRSRPEASQAVADALASWGLDDDQYRIADGSGLSPHNLVTSETLVAVLRRMHDDPQHREAFVRTLPIAGRDGTLTARLRDTAAAANVSAKTGTKTDVRALAGYVTTRDGERLVFAFLANNFAVPSRTVTQTIDRAVERLAIFSRVPDR